MLQFSSTPPANASGVVSRIKALYIEYMGIRILCLGEIVGKPGIYCIKNGLKQVKEDHRIDLVVANGEGATGGFGLGKNHAVYLNKLGIDVITLGEKGFFKKDMVGHIAKAPYMLRPANYPPNVPGRGWRTYQVGEHTVGVVTMLGQSDFSRVHLSNPFTLLPGIIERMAPITPVIILQFHAATTAERNAMFFHADGMVSAVVGTHSKAITADARVFPNGTACITDNGRCGSMTSVGGLEPSIEIEKFLTQIPERSEDVWDDLELQGVIIDVEPDGRSRSIEPLRYPIEGGEPS